MRSDLISLNKAVLFCLVGLAAVVAVSARWPSRPAMYECCCYKENPMCGIDCFVCRNNLFSCDCSTCSCYDVQPRPPRIEKNTASDFIKMLLRGGGGGGMENRWGRKKREAVLPAGNH